MDNPIYQGNEFEVLKTRYVEQAAHLRDLNQYDLRVTGGFITIQLLLASWFASHPLTSWGLKGAIAVTDFAMLIVCLRIMSGARRRRHEIRDTILNINEAFGLYRPGVYLKDKAINPQPLRPGKFRWLVLACVIGYVSAVISLLIPH
jgi:hypothetical protein